jgi:hypothetical protein
MTMRRIELQTEISNNQKAIEWSRSKGLLSSAALCTKCNTPMRECPDKTIDGCAWKCSKTINGVRHQVSLSIRNSSIMAGSHLSIKSILLLMYEWSRMTPIHETAFQLEIEENTAAAWYKRFREFTTYAVRAKLDIQIGGIDEIVEIDECQVEFTLSTDINYL